MRLGLLSALICLLFQLHGIETHKAFARREIVEKIKLNEPATLIDQNVSFLSEFSAVF